MIVKTNHFGIINLDPAQLRIYLSDIDRKWDFEGWDNAILQGLILREDEDGDIIFTVANGLWAQKNGGLPATQDMFSSKEQSGCVRQLFKSMEFSQWVKTRLLDTGNDYVGLMNSERFKRGIIPALEKQWVLQREWVLQHDPGYLQPYEVGGGQEKDKGVVGSWNIIVMGWFRTLCGIDK